MNVVATLRRARTMAGAELRFRTSTALRTHRDRILHGIRAAGWNRRALAANLSPDIPFLRDAAALIRADRCDHAEAVLADHFSARTSAWPIAARGWKETAEAIATLYPSARTDAVRRADGIVDGRYDLLGYRNLKYGRVPDWHLDLVHGRRAPRSFWTDVPYLDPACGDHKIIWELNRHQHWTALGRAFWLDRDPQYARTFVEQLYSWLDANPPLTGVNWASMLELAFRCLSWTWALEFFSASDAPVMSARPWRLDLLTGIDRQLAHVARNLSRYFSPNTHLTGEALALYVVSLALPELRESGSRAQLGREVLLREAQRQVLPDGGHAERSTHYHRYSTDFYLFATIVAQKSEDGAAASLAAAAKTQAHVLRTLADERGGLLTIGDDDGGQLFAMCGTAPSDVRTTLAIAAQVLGDPTLAVSAPTEECCWVAGPASAGAARTLPVAWSPARWPSRLLPDSGYFVSRARGELAIFDAGVHGFLNGGHAHADALAVATTAGSHALLIDPGTGTYTMDPALRDRLRSGRMHNTVLVDGDEHAAVRGPFHWAKTTDAAFLFTYAGERCDIAQGVHDGYSELRHVRTLFTIHGSGWLIVDQILGHGRHRAESFWHIHPAWKLSQDDRAIILTHGDGTRSCLTASVESLELVGAGPDAVHAPEYGRIESAPLVRAVQHAEAPFAMATFVASGKGTVRSVAVAVHSCAAPDGWAAAATVVTSPDFEAVALTAAPTRQQAHAVWPGLRFGIAGHQTTRRAALSVRRGEAAWHIDADGTEIATAELACAVHDESH